MTSKTLLAAALAVVAAPALAESYDAAGVWSYTPGITTMPVSEDLVLIHVSNTYDSFEPADPSSPVGDARGQCFGAIVIHAGQASGGGNCHYSSSDGDELITEWTVEGIGADGRTLGVWAIVGGNGKWAESSGSGAFISGQDATGAYRSELTGEIELR